MKCRRQALRFCLDPAVVVVIQIFNEFQFEVFLGTELLQIQQFTFEQPKEIFYHCVVQTAPLAAHALPDALLAEHPLILPVLILPALIRVKNQVSPVRYFCKRLVQHGGHHAEYRTIRYGIADQIAAVQIENLP